MRGDLLGYLHGIARNEGVHILSAGAVEDHVHMLLVVKPAHAPSEVVKTLKANSSRWIHETYADLGDFAWQSGFGVFSVSESATGSVITYIDRQEEHHRRVPFEQELRLFLEKHGVEHDPEHYLD
jgi:REP element-mobilizing transposase RayT